MIFHPLAVIVEAFKLIHSNYPNARLIIAGRLNSGWGHFQVAGRIQNLVKKMGLDKLVEFQPVYSQEQAPRIYQQADVFLTACYMDVCPTAVIEAMACGLPVIYSASGGTPELVGSEAGVGVAVEASWDYYQVPQPEELAKAILEVAKDKEKMSLAARKRAVEHFDLKPWLKKHQEIFDTLIRC